MKLITKQVAAQKLIVAQLARKYVAFYGILAVHFRTASHWSLSCANLIHSTLSAFETRFDTIIVMDTSVSRE
jgi:hypothetical protein